MYDTYEVRTRRVKALQYLCFYFVYDTYEARTRKVKGLQYLCFHFCVRYIRGVCFYTAVYMLAADGAVYDTHKKKSMVYESRKQSTRAGRIHRGMDTAQDG